MSDAIRTFALTKRFPARRGWKGLLARQELSRPAVDGVDLSVREGELFGLLGPNGAGKTTLIKLLATLILPTSGAALVNGHDLRHEAAIKRSIGLATGDERSFYWRLTGRQNLEFFATLHGIPQGELRERAAASLAQAGLEEVADARFQTYSTGMRQRLSIARALLHRPRLLFLDEPTKGLDPAATRQLHRLIRDELVGLQGMTVFLTTHLLDEAEQLCDRIAVMHLGQMRGCGTMAELRGELNLAGRYTIGVQGLPLEARPRLSSLLPGLQIHTQAAEESRLDFPLSNNPEVLDDALESIRASGGKVLSVTREQPSLEAIFETLTGDIALVSTALNAPLTANTPEKHPELHPERSRRSNRRAFSIIHLALAFLKRDFLEEVSYRVSFFLQFFGIFFSVAVFYFVARVFGQAAAPYLVPYGGDYFAFVLIGLAFSGFFGVGLSGFASSLRQAQTTGTLEAMLMTPTSLSTIILSSSLWSYALTAFRVLVYLAVGAALFGVRLGGGNYPAALLVLALTIVAFSSLGIVAAIFIMVIKRGDPVTWALGTVFALLGGIYYPVAVLPGWLKWVSMLLPVTYSLEAMRQALLQGASLASLTPQLLALSLFSAILLPLSLVSFRYAVRRARMDGSLTQY